MSRLKSYFKDWNYQLYGLYFIIIIFVFFPIMSQHYAMTDDYTMIDIANNHAGNLLNWDIANGRPIYGVFQYFTQYHMINIPRLSWLRSFSVLSSFILCCFIYQFLTRKIKVSSQNFAFYLPIFLIFIPSIVVYNSWASCFVYVLSILLAGLAYNCMFDGDRKTTIWRFIGGEILLICSFFIYQPAAMLFLYFVFLNNCIDNRKIKFINLVVSATALMIAMLISLLFIKIIPKLLYGFLLERSQLSTDFISKINWFFDTPLRLAINNYNIHSTIIYTILSVLLLICGFFYIFKERQGFLKILLTCLLMVGIMTPNLLVKESNLDTRSSIGLYFIVVTVIFYGVIRICERYLSKNNIQFIMVFLLFIIGIYTQYYTYVGVIRQQQAEYQALTQEMASIIPKHYTGLIRFDISDRYDTAFTKLNIPGEIGQTSIQVPWALRGIAQSVKQLKGLNYKIDNNDLVLLPKDSCKTDCIIIHTSDILRKAENYK